MAGVDSEMESAKGGGKQRVIPESAITIEIRAAHIGDDHPGGEIENGGRGREGNDGLNNWVGETRKKEEDIERG